MGPVLPTAVTGKRRRGGRQVTRSRHPHVCPPPSTTWGLADALAAAAEAGFDPTRLTVVQVVSTAVLVHDDVVVKVHPPSVDAARQGRMLQACASWAAEGLAVPPLTIEPVVSAWGTVTTWPRVEATARPLDWEAVGDLLARLHRSGGDAITDAWQPLRRLDAQLAAARLAGALDAEASEALTAAAADLRASTAAIGDRPAVLHGDVSPANVLMAPGGPVLIDFDQACVGPPRLDLTAAARHADEAGAGTALRSGYGADPDAWPHRPIVDAIHALGALTFRLALAATQPVDPAWVRAEVAGWRTGVRS
jgi:hypothetical protein